MEYTRNNGHSVFISQQLCNLPCMFLARVKCFEFTKFSDKILEVYCRKNREKREKT